MPGNFEAVPLAVAGDFDAMIGRLGAVVVDLGVTPLGTRRG